MGVKVPNNLGGLDVIKQYQTKDSKPIGDYEQLVYNYLNAKYDAELELQKLKQPHNKNKAQQPVEQKQQSNKLYAQYLSQNPNGNIEGFKQWNNRQQEINELFDLILNQLMKYMKQWD